MQDRFKTFKRGKVFYCEDLTTGQQKSLQTRDEADAQRIVQAKNDAVKLPQMNLVMAKTYLSAQDPKMITRTWADVMERFCDRSKKTADAHAARARCHAPSRCSFLKPKRLIETTADDFFAALKLGTNSTIAFLQTLHNDALGMGWIPSPILPRKLWPKAKKKDRRAITAEEHARVMLAVADEEWRLYLQLLWFTGASQTDGANLVLRKSGLEKPRADLSAEKTRRPQPAARLLDHRQRT